MKDSEKKSIYKKIGKRVKELRLEKGATQYQCYLDTGIHFGRLEKGERDISFTTLLKLSDYFNLSLDEFWNH